MNMFQTRLGIGLKQGYRYHKILKTFSKFIDDIMI